MLKLRLYPDPIFKQIAKPVTLFDNHIIELETQFKKILINYEALGLGANMLGLLDRIIIVSDGSDPIFMVNPQITFYHPELSKDFEASLSIPNISLEINRCCFINVKYQTATGEEQSLEARGLLARVIQHEIDYLDGITIFDRLSPTKRIISIERYNKLRKSKNKY